MSNSVPLPASLYSALRSNGSVAGDRVERRKRRTYRMGWIGGRSDREHGHEFKLHVHLHLNCGNRAVPIRSVVLSAECHVRGSDSHRGYGATAIRSAGRNERTFVDPDSRRGKPLCKGIRGRRKSVASRRRSSFPPPCCRQARRASPNPPQYLDPVTNKLDGQSSRHVAANSCPNHRRAFWTGCEPANLLRATWQLRHSQQPGPTARDSSDATWRRHSNTSMDS